MRNQIKLFINGLQVDLKEDLNILFTYQLEDRTNPTTIKNHYSKNITIEEVEGTPRNSLIFGLFSFSDRRVGQGGTPGNQFDPSKRVPFELYVNGDLQESGYAQLTKVTKSGRKVVYSITLYGGLGDFWYSLHMKDNGETRTLADLKWNNTDENGSILPVDDEFSFRINKDAVMGAWNRLGSTSGSQLWDTINFATLYPGNPDNFDSDKMLVNTNESLVFPTNLTSGDSAYTTVNGYGMAEFEKSYDCWAVRDLRSYLQKPVLSIRRFIETCCNPENNGGYTVDLDPDFFNVANPYYAKAWVTLPSLIVDGGDDASSTYGDNNMAFNPLTQRLDTTTTPPGHSSDKYMNGASAATVADITGNTVTVVNNVLELSDFPFSYVDAYMDAGMVAEASTREELTLTKTIITETGIFNRKRLTDLWCTVFSQLVAFNADTGEKIGGSDIYRFCSPDRMDPAFYTWLKTFFRVIEGASYDVSAVLGPDFYPGNIVDIKGTFQYDSSVGYHKFVSTDNYYRWRYDLQRLPKVDRIRYKMVTAQIYGCSGYKADDTYYNYFGDKLAYITQNAVAYAPKKVISYGGNVAVQVPNEISSGAKITKKKLLSTDESAADFLLSYSKLFGLYWWKDIYSNTIYCRTRNDYFTGEIEDLEDRIDRSKDIVTTPILFDKQIERQAHTR